MESKEKEIRWIYAQKIFFSYTSSLSTVCLCLALTLGTQGSLTSLYAASSL